MRLFVKCEKRGNFIAARLAVLGLRIAHLCRTSNAEAHAQYVFTHTPQGAPC